jgi:hypothetical protein
MILRSVEEGPVVQLMLQVLASHVADDTNDHTGNDHTNDNDDNNNSVIFGLRSRRVGRRRCRSEGMVSIESDLVSVKIHLDALIAREVPSTDHKFIIVVRTKFIDSDLNGNSAIIQV